MFGQVIKNFGINVNALNERNTVSSGDLITGHISFGLTKQTKITSITMTVTGKVHVHWSTSGGGGRKGRNRRRNFSGKVEYFNFSSIILAENSATGVASRLEPGTHVYPFTCQLPLGNFPSSFRGAHGEIVYSLTVAIHRPWHMSKTFVTELNFVHHINPNQPELWAPLSGTNSMTVCSLLCTSGALSMTVSTERKAFRPGETVKIICDIDNASSQTITPEVKLQQKQAFYTQNKVHSRMIVKTLVYKTGQPISGHTSDVHAELMVTIPSLSVPSISNCSILEVEYPIKVSLKVRACSELTVLVPIILCDASVSAPPPSYL
ncbi:arrestin domain-containing protein 3-like [Chaetodon trifascialis]|uniref:arrestin domain-containing protein 3-like n=1 Tax=Chaetodon trifascialis TaxID=109706 RepID=UPI003995E01F